MNVIVCVNVTGDVLCIHTHALRVYECECGCVSVCVVRVCERVNVTVCVCVSYCKCVSVFGGPAPLQGPQLLPLLPPHPPSPQAEQSPALGDWLSELLVKVSASQSDAKILQELFGGGYLEIRPCEGPRVQIQPLGLQRRTGSGCTGCLEGARVARSPRAPQASSAPHRTAPRRAGGSASSSGFQLLLLCRTSTPFPSPPLAAGG